ncbi:hypothetical protein [Companilactobacillus versmoldensis]|uniref:Zinc-ribbon domain-containing protein n=1 Tax=Companilactobacillus versmoldensis DSM 14857 = KCTC 3814 TaxID=1423815 RepID=A0A0R1SQC0_9LACO|nr:hypothetical protein [Companilactobacillus versmoldensis]KRL68453.1 hypothetical protein FC27_GL000151 [Companilactobacillus versmoldensis DSM 14857 = KCTC 3814]
MQETRYCYKCGKNIGGNIQFCPYCGARQVNTPNSLNNQANQFFNHQPYDEATAKNMLIIGWVCVGLAIVTTIGLLEIAAFVLGLLVYRKCAPYKNYGMALWITASACFGIEIVIGPWSYILAV